jgi:hypothetical protein
MVILRGLFVSNRNGAVGEWRLVRRGAGAGMAEKLAIRKCVFIDSEGVSSIFNIWRLAIRKWRAGSGAGALAVEARAAWTT